MNAKTTILVNRLMVNFSEVVNNLQEAVNNNLPKDEIRSVVETLASVIGGTIGYEINVCIHKKVSFIGIAKFDSDNIIVTNQRFPIAHGIDFIKRSLMNAINE